MISVLVLTLDEEANLPACLESVRWSDDVVVLDSGSKDRTVQIAQSFNARVLSRPFDDERTHRTWAIHEIPFKYPWVYNPDADEITPRELADEMRETVAAPGRKEVAYRVRFKNMFMGRWIRHASLYPTWVLRLFQPARLTYERSINLRAIVDGTEGKLRGHFLHYSFNKGMDAWWEKHRRYAEQEAVESLRSLSQGSIPWSGLFSSETVTRRSALKELSFRLPFRPTLRFLYMYFWRLGILDGAAGLRYCRLLSQYEALIVRRMRELRRQASGGSVPR